MGDKPPKTGSKQPPKSYKDTLDQVTRERYDQKIALIGVDPYSLTKSMMTTAHDCLPAITYIDIINYLVCSKSAYTMEELKAVKSLEAYNQYVNGWVKDVMSMAVNNKVLVTGRVRHSQRMNETPLKPWVIASMDGIVDCAHCDCMAGLGEVCTHVGALLFYIEQAFKINSCKTVTQEKAYWLLPASIDKVPYAEIQDIDFTSTNNKKKQMDCAINGESIQKRASHKLPDIPEPTPEEIRELNSALNKTETKPSILSVTAEFQDSFVPEIMKDGQLPVCLVNLKDDKYMDMDRSELEKECAVVYEKLALTEDQCKNAQYITKEQSKSKEWHAMRIGRITASNMKSVCTSSPENPSSSTVKSICGSNKFRNAATQWGCKHETVALAAYTQKVKKDHVNVSVERCGLFLNPKYPHIGASPDAVVSCDCCGEGVVEVKCPYCVKDQFLSDVDKRVEFLDNGKLKVNHKYSYQVQTQLLVTEREFCDFVVWTEKDYSIERIEPNVSIQETIRTKSTTFFVKVILPEIMGNLVTRERQERACHSVPSVSTLPSKTVVGQLDTSDPNAAKPNQLVLSPITNSNNLSKHTGEEIICICQQPYKEEDDVIGCDNENCPYVWLHFTCVEIINVPKGSYFCPECRKQRKRLKC